MQNEGDDVQPALLATVPEDPEDPLLSDKPLFERPDASCGGCPRYSIGCGDSHTRRPIT